MKSINEKSKQEEGDREKAWNQEQFTKETDGAS